MPEAGLYIHFPFCRHKCIYCDFYSTTDLPQIDRLVEALHREITLWAENPLFLDVHFSTIYFGGGTPSLMTPRAVGAILARLFSAFVFNADTEISLEVNPGTLLNKNLADYKAVGVNRLTIGVQSFHDAELKTLTRIHSAAEAKAAIANARRAGFHNIGIDLIFGIPGQTIQQWAENLQTAVANNPDHISAYGLTYETNTPLWQMLQTGAVAKCAEELERDMFLAAAEFLSQQGYEHYEISNYARPGYFSRHNQKYWDGSPFLGLGPAAHSFSENKRWWNVRDLRLYIEMLQNGESPIAGQEELDQTNRINELVLLGLRRRGGITRSAWEQLTRAPFTDLIAAASTTGPLDVVPPFLSSHHENLLTVWQDSLCLTRQGLLLYDTLCEKLAGLLHKS